MDDTNEKDKQTATASSIKSTGLLSELRMIIADKILYMALWLYPRGIEFENLCLHLNAHFKWVLNLEKYSKYKRR